VQSIGALLRKARRDKKLKTQDIRESTKIPVRYIEALENDNFDVLPGDTYVKGFLKKIAEFLGLNPKEIVNLYKYRHNPQASSGGPPVSSAKDEDNTITPAREEPLNTSTIKTYDHPVWEEKDGEQTEESSKAQRSKHISAHVQKQLKNVEENEKRQNNSQKIIIISTVAIVVAALITAGIWTFIHFSEMQQDNTPAVLKNQAQAKQSEYTFNGKYLDMENLEQGDKVSLVLQKPMRTFAVHVTDLSFRDIALTISGDNIEKSVKIEKYGHKTLKLGSSKIDELKIVFVAVSTEKLAAKLSWEKTHFETAGLDDPSAEEVKAINKKQNIVFEAKVKGKCFIQATCDGVEEGGIEYRKQQTFRRVAKKIMQVRVGNLRVLDIKVNGKKFPNYAKTTAIITLKWQPDPLNKNRKKLVKFVQ